MARSHGLPLAIACVLGAALAPAAQASTPFHPRVRGALGLIPHLRPSRGDIFGAVKVNYKLFTNVLGLVVFTTLMGLTVRRGATDPACGMKVDRHKAIRMNFAGETHYFCSRHCLHAYELDRGTEPAAAAEATTPGEPAATP